METLDFTFETRIELEKRDARLEGKCDALLLVLQKFNPSQELVDRLYNITDMNTVDLLLQKAATAHSIEEFEEYMNQL